MTSQEKLLQLVRLKDRESRKNFQPQSIMPQRQSATPIQEDNQSWINSFLRIITAVVVIILLGVIIYFGWYWFGQKSVDNLSVITQSEEVNSPIEINQAAPVIEPAEDNQPQPQSQIIDTPTESVVMPVVEPVLDEKIEEPVKISLPPLYEEIRLAGIVMDERPNAIVEDLKTHTTKFLFVGENISGAVLVELNADKAIFEYDGQKVELRP